MKNNELTVYNDEIVELDIYERIRLHKAIQVEKERTIMTAIAYTIIGINVVGILACMVAVIINLLTTASP